MLKVILKCVSIVVFEIIANFAEKCHFPAITTSFYEQNNYFPTAVHRKFIFLQNQF